MLAEPLHGETRATELPSTGSLPFRETSIVHVDSSHEHKEFVANSQALNDSKLEELFKKNYD